jgi:putative peptidoglycan binding protein
MNNSKVVVFTSCLFAATLTDPLVTAAAHGGFSGGHSFAGRPGMGMPGRPGMGMRSGFNRHDRFDNDFIFIGSFGFPSWWGWGYPYGNYGYGAPYGNGYGYGDYGYGNGSSVEQLQLRLARAGYYHGAIDGIMGPATRRAIRAYERTHNQREYGMTERY